MLLVLDTNVLISFVIGKKGAVVTLRRLWQRKQFTLATSDEILAELAHALTYPEVQKRHRFSPAQMHVYLSTLRHKAAIFPGIKPVEAQAPDATDAKFLVCADEAQASAIVSGDDDLIRMHRYKGIHIP